MMVDTYLALLRDTNTMRNELEASAYVMSLRGLNPEVRLASSLLGTIQAPVHFLWGEEDPFGGEAIARALAAQIPNATLEMVPAGGHAVWIDDLDLASEVARAFLGGA